MGIHRRPGQASGAFSLLILDPGAKREVLHASLESGLSGRSSQWKVRARAGVVLHCGGCCRWRWSSDAGCTLLQAKLVLPEQQLRDPEYQVVHVRPALVGGGVGPQLRVLSRCYDV